MAIEIKDAQGKQVRATDVGIESSVEHFNTVKLVDGTVLRIKVVATKARRLEGQFDQQGYPIYLLESKNVLVVDSVPEVLQKGGPDGTIRH